MGEMDDGGAVGLADDRGVGRGWRPKGELEAKARTYRGGTFPVSAASSYPNPGAYRGRRAERNTAHLWPCPVPSSGRLRERLRRFVDHVSFLGRGPLLAGGARARLRVLEGQVPEVDEVGALLWVTCSCCWAERSFTPRSSSSEVAAPGGYAAGQAPRRDATRPRSVRLLRNY
jgi:hypothetical protein